MTTNLKPLTRSALGSILAFSLLLFAPAAIAQDATTEERTPDSVVATVGGEVITEGDLVFAAEDLQEEISQIPPQQLRAFLTGVLIDMKVMAQAARAADMAETDVFKRRAKYLEDRALRRAYFTDVISAKVDDAAVQAAYDELVANFEPKEEVRARHILVQDGELIQSIKAEIEGGKPFEVAAMEHSIDGSAQNGGDLGYFSRGMMVPPFEEAAFALEPGALSEPVQSQFGWHLIKLEDKRQSSAPPMEQVQPQLRQQALINAFNTTINDLKSGLEVTFTDPALGAAIEAQSGTN